jgi:fused signal recognition particle receptor
LKRGAADATPAADSAGYNPRVGLFDLFKRKPKPQPEAPAELAAPAPASAPPVPARPAAAAPPPPAETAAPLRQRSKWLVALNRTRAMLTAAFAADPEQLVDEDYFTELMDGLVMADVGVDLAQRLVKQIEREMHDRGLVRRRDALRVVRDVLLAKLTDVQPPQPLEPGRLNVIMLVGVNGNGKTTLAAKLAHRLKGEGRKVLLAAADTFRAAAVDQLKVWAERVGVDIVLGASGADPASVIYDATAAAQSRGTEVLIVDTAGRLQTKHNLMAELQKIARTVEKAFQGTTAPAITNLLVLDATVGQNSLSQAQLFNEACNLSGVALTKLDGTARGGGALAIVDLLKVPIVFAGVGESVDDLLDFDAADYITGLLPEA